MGLRRWSSLRGIWDAISKEVKASAAGCRNHRHSKEPARKTLQCLAPAFAGGKASIAQAVKTNGYARAEFVRALN